MLGKQLIQAASGSAAAGGGLYVDDVFSTFLYDGTSSGHTVTNGLDLGGEGGLVWLKNRTGYASHALISSDNNFLGWLESNSTSGRAGTVAYVTGNSDGFTLNNGGLFFNNNGQDYTSWSFRKAPGFFDVVTYTGTGTVQNISHSLGSVPGMIIVKSTSATTSSWNVYHRSTGANGVIYLNGTFGNSVDTTVWNNTAPTSSVFTVGADAGVNANNASYIAYVFAHDDQSFGTAGNESIIKCDLTTMPSSGTWHDVNLTWEPQWVLVKNSNASFATNWHIFDNMRGAVTGGNDSDLSPDTNSNESLADLIEFTPRGFRLNVGQFGTNQSVIYMAIRRPNKPPSAATDVFKPVAASNGDKAAATGFVTDYCLWRSRGSSVYNATSSTRLTGTSTLFTSSAASESNYIALSAWQTNDGMNHRGIWSATTATVSYFFKRAPGFFDVVAYTGTGATQSIAHNLEVAPEIIVCKKRSSGTNRDWVVGVEDLNQYLVLQESGVGGGANSFPFMFPSSPTSTAFSISSSSFVNESTHSYISYLFATLPGVSKIGTYSGTNNTNVTVDCGFSSGPRFIMIKRTDSTSSWAVMDSARGINSGTNSYDPTLYLDLTTAEAAYADYIDPTSSGFTVKPSATAGGFNNTGGTFLFLAIA